MFNMLIYQLSGHHMGRNMKDLFTVNNTFVIQKFSK